MECSGVHGYCDCSRTHHHHHHGLLNPSSFFSHTSSSSSSSAHDPTSSSSSVESSGIGNQRLVVDTISALFVKLIATILACIFALVGSFIGAFTGALLGRTTESGFFRGAGIGAISGAVFTVEMFESCLSCWHSDQSGIWNVMIEINLIPGLLNGRLVREQVGPAMLSAVGSQISALDTSFDEVHDIFETGEAKGMSRDSIKKLPKIKIKPENNITDSSGERICCSVCLQEFQEGESARCLPHCQHMFHMPCIDSWLTRHASCPLCRRDL